MSNSVNISAPSANPEKVRVTLTFDVSAAIGMNELAAVKTLCEAVFSVLAVGAKQGESRFIQKGFENQLNHARSHMDHVSMCYAMFGDHKMDRDMGTPELWNVASRVCLGIHLQKLAFPFLFDSWSSVHGEDLQWSTVGAEVKS